MTAPLLARPRSVASGRTRALCRAMLSCALVVLSACNTLPPQVDSGLMPVERPHIERFTLEGRFSASDGEQAANGPLEWQHSPERQEWLLLTPLGQIAARLSASAQGVTLQTGDGRLHQAEHIDPLIAELLGVPAPVDGLSHWVQASVRSGARVLALDPVGRPGRVTDAGWIIDYPSYADDSPQALPRRIDAQWGNARIRLIIDAWTPAQ